MSALTPPGAGAPGAADSKMPESSTFYLSTRAGSLRGYRRVTALLNRELQRDGNAPVNHKRVYRLMSQNGLLLARHTGRGRQVNHDGKVITLRSNPRWCSDTFEIPCWNGEKVRVAFVLDTCDRETIRYVGTTAGISGEMIRDLMVEAVEARFGATATPHPKAVDTTALPTQISKEAF